MEKFTKLWKKHMYLLWLNLVSSSCLFHFLPIFQNIFCYFLFFCHIFLYHWEKIGILLYSRNRQSRLPDKVEMNETCSPCIIKITMLDCYHYLTPYSDISGYFYRLCEICGKDSPRLFCCFLLCQSEKDKCIMAVKSGRQLHWKFQKIHQKLHRIYSICSKI